MAIRKLLCLLLNRRHFDINTAQIYETKVWTTKMNGMMARSTSFSAVNWDASFVKTATSVNHAFTSCECSYLGME